MVLWTRRDGLTRLWRLRDTLCRLALAALLPLAAALPAEHAQAVCSGVKIKALQPLDFGFVRMPKNAAGWVLVLPNGGYAFSPGIAFSNRLPRPGLVRLTAPPQSTVLLSLSPGNPRAAGPLRLLSVKPEQQQTPLVSRGDLWEVHTPPSDEGSVTVMLAIGGELQVISTDKFWDVSFGLNMECVGVEKDH